MIDTILNFLGQGISATFSWFDALLDSTGSRVILYGFITMALVFKFIILPFSGSGGVGQSDRVVDTARKSGLFSNPDKDKKP